MYDARRKLVEFLDRIVSEGGMSDGDAVKVLSLTRQLCEQKELQDQHSLMNFYCNWCLHTSLDRSNTCYRMLLSITDVLLSDDGSSRVDVPLAISELLDFKRLRAQFIEMYEAEKLPTFLFTSLTNWRGFATMLMKEIIEKPICLPDPDPINKNRTAKRIIGELQSKAGHRPMLMAQKLWLSDSEQEKMGEVWWFVETLPNVQICGKLAFTESAADFAGP